MPVGPMSSKMPQLYIHYFGNESSKSLLEASGIIKKTSGELVSLKSKQCPNCNESNKQDSKFCVHCRMVLTYDAYNETLDEQKKKEDKLAIIEGQFNTTQSQMRALVNELGLHAISINFSSSHSHSSVIMNLTL